MVRIITAFAIILACTPVIHAQTVDRESIDATTMTASSQPAAAQTVQSAELAKQPSTYDKIWKFAEWYENASNPWFRRCCSADDTSTSTPVSMPTRATLASGTCVGCGLARK